MYTKCVIQNPYKPMEIVLLDPLALGEPLTRDEQIGYNENNVGVESHGEEISHFLCNISVFM